MAACTGGGEGDGTSGESAYAPAQLRHAHGGGRSRPAYRANHPRTCRYFDYTGVHASRAGSVEGSSQASSTIEAADESRCRRKRVTPTGPMTKAIQQFLRSLQQRNASPNTILAYTKDLNGFVVYIGEEKPA